MFEFAKDGEPHLVDELNDELKDEKTDDVSD